MLESVTMNLKTVSISAFGVKKGEKKPCEFTLVHPVTFRNNRDFTDDEVDAIAEKALAKKDVRLAYVDSYAHSVKHYALSVEKFVDNSTVIVRAKKEDGGTGRTREPIVSREISTTTVKAYIVPKGTKKAVERVFTFGDALGVEEAEKAVEKAGKKAAFRLAYVDEISVDSKLRAMPLSKYIELATAED